MSHRTQITLEDEQYARLRAESAHTGLGLAELVRRAIDEVYGSSTVTERQLRLEASFGAWAIVEMGDDVDGAEYVEKLRGGLGSRLARQ
ncbi:ribbon-helix-helix domain-containing protein [Nocardioides sp. WS12]|uniref:ribbon-helix-helix domain-containing protein n=1 Tax=Nocardioides sp. WS12 TaxID=2486272 RepID=UPI0015FCA092|nr:ribbon-helix-helix domain-containing protein [Nocardioides sp. WS12]